MSDGLIAHCKRGRAHPDHCPMRRRFCPSKRTILATLTRLVVMVVAAVAFFVTFKKHLTDGSLGWISWTYIGTMKNATKHNGKITILMWVNVFSQQFGQEMLSSCSEQNCYLTHDRKEFRQSSAVVFHDRNINCKDLPEERLPDQHFVFFLMEAPYHVSPRAFRQLSTNFYTLTMSYRRDADIHSPFGYFKRRSTPLPSAFWQKLRKLVAGKKKLVAWFVKNCDTPSARELYVAQLQLHIPVDVYGKCGPLRCPRGSPRCSEALKQNYKFYIAFENSVCKDYVTEKYFDRLNDFVVPIVFGRKIYDAIGPKNSFIAVDDFNSTKELADYLKRLDKDDEQYLSYFEWMNQAESVGSRESIGGAFCGLCRKLREQREGLAVTASETAKNVTAWYKQPGTCHDQYGRNVHKLYVGHPFA